MSQVRFLLVGNSNEQRLRAAVCAYGNVWYASIMCAYVCVHACMGVRVRACVRVYGVYGCVWVCGAVQAGSEAMGGVKETTYETPLVGKPTIQTLAASGTRW